MTDRSWGFRTRALHAGGQPDPHTGARAVPIYQSTSFVFEDTADAADLFALQKYGTIYTRLSNPTTAAFEERVASLEGAIGSVATASGQAAEFLALSTLAGQGDHIVSASGVYGGSYTLMATTMARFGIETSFVDNDSVDAFAAAIRPETKALYTEIIGNPRGSVADVEALSDLAHANGLPLVIDATFATPYLCRPMEFGADIVLHSATKFIGGHGTSIGGVVSEAGTFDWSSGRFPRFTEPVPTYNGLQWWGNFGEYAYCTALRAEQLRDVGASLSPFNAFMLLQGLETFAAPDGSPRGERTGDRHRARCRRSCGLGCPCRPARFAVPVPGREVPATRRRCDLHFRGEGRPRGGSPIHRVAPDDQPPCERRRRQNPCDTSRLDYPPTVERRAAGGGRGYPRHDPVVGWPRRRRRYLVGHRPGARCGPGWSQMITAPSATVRKRILDDATSIAIVGASSNPARSSNFVLAYLQSSVCDFDLYPVNPRETEINGVQVFPSLADLPIVPDIVDVFRKADDCPAIAEEAVAIGAKVLWLQLGIVSEEAAEIAMAGGLEVVMDRCTKIEHARFAGGLHLAGFNTGVISSKRHR